MMGRGEKRGRRGVKKKSRKKMEREGKRKRSE